MGDCISSIILRIVELKTKCNKIQQKKTYKETVRFTFYYQDPLVFLHHMRIVHLVHVPLDILL
jgi:hypothetical protein